MKEIKRLAMFIALAVFISSAWVAETHAAKTIRMGDTVSGTLSESSSLDEYSLRLDAATDLAFAMICNASDNSYGIEWIVMIESTDGNISEFYADSSPEIADTLEFHQGVASWRKIQPTRLPAGSYLLTISAPHYIFADEAGDDYVSNGLEVDYSFALTSGQGSDSYEDSYDYYDDSYYDTSDARTPQAVIDLNTKTYTAFGERITLSDSTLHPFIDAKGNTMIPIRFLDELHLVGAIEWYGDQKKIIIDNLDWQVELHVGSSTVYINDVPYTMYDSAGNPVTPYMRNGRTYLPLRALFQTALGYDSSDINYSNKVITIY